MEKLINSVKKLSGVSRNNAVPGMTRSDYSLVSCTELTTGQLWLSLPEEVKGDPAFESLRQLYESERSKETIPLTLKNGSASKTKRLPSVNSAPHLNNNVMAPEDVPRVELSPLGTEKEEIKLKCSNEEGQHHKQSKIAKARHYTKMTLLLGCWVFFTVVFLMYNENEVVTRTTYVTSDAKSYILKVSENQLRILLELSGPFLSEQNEQKLNSTQLASADVVEVWLERWRLRPGILQYSGDNDIDTKEFSPTWKLVLQNREDVDFNIGEPRSQVLNIGPRDMNTTVVYAIRMNTNTNITTPLKMSYTLNPLDVSTGVLYACVLLVALYVLIIFEVINRTMAAVMVSTTSVAVLAIVGERPSLPELVSWLDIETLLLLFSMMLLVAIMAETGMFDFLAVFTFEVTKGKLWPLITLLCAITALLSTFLDNVTTVLLMTPVTIRLCEVMDLDPVPILMSMVLYSNIGGTMTPVGDPPNVIIASNKAVIQSGINFTNFTIHMSLGILLVCVQTYCQLRYMYRDTNKLRLKVPRDIQELRHQISIWRRAADSLPHLSKDVQIVRERLERKIKKLNVQLDNRLKENTKRACPKSTFQSTLQEMKDKYKIRDKILLVKASVAITFVVAVFFLHSIPEFNRVTLGWTALLGAILVLTLADREDLEPILHRVEWSTLLFFASLFVLMEALSKLGLIQYIGGLTESLILKVDESSRLAAAIILLLWVSGLTSAFVDNIPLTTMMVRIVTSLGSNPNLNLPMTPLVWALAYGACLGGNGTLIGASANVVCAGVAEQYGYKFTFLQFFKIGFPIMLGHLVVASFYLLMCHCAFDWH
ncbi:P protein-like isoform X2 [Plodia interpunctella]|uniref:P protein-like isoform X2 n=1 Tax=Plodia interpunctella TaxID=58824 RepID=UPI002367A32F|nr:P protein-like isoform X2 [Plodia interpunctella]XP_053622095.1 P protein-like isoform X2 [Plodia interpunctella]XP_053622096.1 P protein-like isoform X2 [Plodia interpunctella]XP_053622097.1 P protein-like isoform X2 [Plodia interpunctella]